MFDFDSFHKAKTIDEAVGLLSQNPRSIPIAGGTDVLVRLRHGHPDYRHLVDIHDVPELKRITLAPDGAIFIGSGATFSELLKSDVILRYLPVLAKGAQSVGGPQIRNMATIGGNLCNGAPSADSAAPLLVLNAKVVLKGPKEERLIPLSDFYQGPGQVDRKQFELLTAIRIDSDDYQCRWGAYEKYAMRGAMDIATIGCAASLKTEAGRVGDLRLAFTVAAPTPIRCPRTEEKARGARLDETLLEIVADSVLSDLRPRDSWRAPKAFREHIIRNLGSRVVQKSMEQCGGVP
jgi:xanthine dehydrogenase FAD-binding subunit